MNTKKKKIIISLIAFDVVIILAAIIIYTHNNKQLEQSAETIESTPETVIEVTEEETPEPTAEPTEELTDTVYGSYENIESLFYLIDEPLIDDDSDIEEVPDEIYIYDSVPITLSEETGAAFIANLEENGWHDHIFDTTDIDGLYFIGTKENTEIITSTDEYVESVREFVEVSGLVDYFEENGMELTEEIQGEGMNCTVFYWQTVDGQKTGGYLRINVESDNNCTECKMYLLESTVVNSLPSLSLEKALETAFCFSGEIYQEINDEDFYVHRVDIWYRYGMPYYDIDIYSLDYYIMIDCYSPVISLEDILADEILLEKFMNLVGD